MKEYPAAASSPGTAANASDQSAAPARPARLLGGILFYALLVLPVIVAVPYGSAESWWEAFFECAVFLLAVLWIIEGLLTGSWLAGPRSLWLPVLALILYAWLQSVPFACGGREQAEAALGSKVCYAISADPFETRRFVTRLVALALYGLMMMRYAAGARRLRALMHVVIAVAAGSAFFGIVRQTMQRAEIGFLLPFLKKGLGYGQFINANHFAFLMEMSLGLVLGLLVGRGVRRERVLIYVALLLPIWTALVLSNSRGGLLAMLGQLIFVALLFTILPSPERRGEAGRGERRSVIGDERLSRLRRLGGSLPVRLALAAVLVLAVTAGVFFVGGEPMIGKLEASQTELAGGEGATARQNASRKEIWRATWTLIKDQPITGVGFGGYWAAIPTYHDASGELTPQQAHNDYLELLASGGIIGLILTLWLVIIFLWRVRERLRAQSDGLCRALCFGALAGLFGVAVHSIVDFGLHITINALCFVALMVIATADCRASEANHRAGGRHPSRRKTTAGAGS